VGSLLGGWGAPPFWPWGQMIGALVDDCDEHTLASWLGAGGTAHVAQLVPGLAGRLGRPRSPRLPPRAGRVGPGFWALVSGGGAIFVSAVHFGPTAVEPPELILDHYQPPVLGWLAFGWLVTFVTVLAITCLYETRLWAQQRQTRRATEQATGVGRGR
jgi:hypothetical protein